MPDRTQGHGSPLHDFFAVVESTESLPRQTCSLDTLPSPGERVTPLAPHSEEWHTTVFGEPSSIDSERFAPPCPADFTDRFLLPLLSRNEYLRLHMLWYYTRGLQDDVELLQKLSQILDMVKQLIGGWELGLIGIVEAETFARIVASNMPFAVIHRRDSPCSHTINQHPGTVFTVTDMLYDWRFENSPTAEVGGLRSYAGTQIMLTRSDKETVSFGSLCLASRTVQPPLSHEQKSMLVRAANMISGEIVNRMRLRRLTTRQEMMETLETIRKQGDDVDIDRYIVDSIQKHYQDCEVRTTEVHFGKAMLSKETEIELESIENGVWEDKDFVKQSIETGDLPRTLCDQPIRAAIGQVVSEQEVLVVCTFNIRYIFDDVDAWFMEQCAHILQNARQARSLREALASKDRFISSVRHELRTPIHGILCSTELMAEELRARSLPNYAGSDEATLLHFLQTIRSSGTELMTTVNNILRLQTITAQSLNAGQSDPIYDLHSIEADLVDELFASYTEDSLTGLSLRFDIRNGASTTIRVDWETVKEILKALLFNAITATPNGTVIVTTSIDPMTRTLCFDIIDTGIGIAKEDHVVIFKQFEKVQEHSKGAGLGLSLASMMATSLKGDLTLVASAVHQGSHFRFTIPRVPPATRPTMPVRRWSKKGKHIPPKYYVKSQSQRNMHLLEHLQSHLDFYGLERSDDAEGTLIIMNEPDPLSSCEITHLAGLTEAHLILLVSSSVPTKHQKTCLEETLQPHHIMLVTGPFHTSRLDDILEEASALIETQKRPQPQPLQFTDAVALDRPPSNDSETSVKSCEATPPTTPLVELDRLVLSPPVLSPDVTSPPALDSSQPRVLLVDDNKVNLSVLQMFCKKRKFEFGSAMDGHEAIRSYQTALVERKPYNLVLMDVQMPNCDGLTATRFIRSIELESGLQRSIIFTVTAQDSSADRKASLDAGADEFFCKPVSMKRLNQGIAAHFAVVDGLRR